MKTLTEKRFFEWHEDDVSVTLRNKGGSYGGGSEVLVICTIPTRSNHCAKTIAEQTIRQPRQINNRGYE